MYQSAVIYQEGSANALDQLKADLATVVPGRALSVLSRDLMTGTFPCRNGERSMIARLHADGCRTPVVRVGNAGNGNGSTTATEAAFPIVVRGGMSHVLLVAGKGLSDGDVRLISAYCRQTALALERLALQVNFERTIDRLTTLVSLVDDLSIDQSFRVLLQTILDQSAELLLAEQGSIMLVEKETDQLLLEAVKGAEWGPEGDVRMPRGAGIAGRVVQTGEPILVADIERDPRVLKKNDGRFKSPSFVVVPLKLDRRVVGVMNFNDKRTGELFDDVDLRLAQTCAFHAAVVLDRRKIYEQTVRLTRQATTDELTGLLNRGCILGRLREELARSERYGEVLSVAMVDLDGFKDINDRSGHSRGDLALKRVAELMMRAVRSIDIVGRYGGDEFIVILPETDASFAAHTAERLREDLERNDILCGTELSGRHRITASIGIATFPAHGTSLEALIDRADEALYRAKASGRNRVVIY